MPSRRPEWIRPAIQRMEAGSAENAAGNVGDNQITFS